MASTMSPFYDYDRQTLQLLLFDARWKYFPPSYEELSSVMSGCRDEVFRRKLGVMFEGPKASGMQAICDIALQIPWVPPQELPSHKLLIHNGVIGKVLIGLGIIAYVCLACYAVERYYQAVFRPTSELGILNIDAEFDNWFTIGVYDILISLAVILSRIETQCALYSGFAPFFDSDRGLSLATILSSREYVRNSIRIVLVQTWLSDTPRPTMKAPSEKRLAIVIATLTLIETHHRCLLLKSTDHREKGWSSGMGLFVQHKEWNAR
ncbi:hypothetical protein BDR22DRAFT_904757 [Usnea florida]